VPFRDKPVIVKIQVPEYIEARIRQRPPEGLPVVRGSTPVVAFGDVRGAEVATLGLNPSKKEFLDDNGNELTGAEQRLETLTSLKESDLSLASPGVIRKVFDCCNNYFQRNPYRKWFDKLEDILTPLEWSYYSGSGCHLDLVQWATNPTWRGLPHDDGKTLIEGDLWFLRKQVSHEHIRVLLLNGSSVVKAYTTSFGCELVQKGISGRVGWNLFVGRNEQGVRVIGGNKNLQGSPGVSKEDRKVLSMAIKKELIDG